MTIGPLHLQDFPFFAPEVASKESIFQALFSAEYNKLCRYALSYMQDEHAAEDVVQDTFIRIWETKQDLISSPEIRYYLVTAVRNNCISALRKLKSSNIHFTETTPEGEAEPYFTRRQHQEEADEKKARISAALDTLPPKCKEVFLMVKLHSMSYKQVAEALDISIKTVENQMGKALRMLRESASLAAIWLFISFLLVKPLLYVGVLLTKHVLS